jgi:hypothetical protein
MPFAPTFATAAFAVVHVTACPCMTFPLASFTVAVSPWLPPTANVIGVGTTATDATVAGGGAAMTVRLAVPVFPPLAAVIVTEPAATAETRPPAFTVAMAWALLVHATAAPAIALPEASFIVAVSCCVAPIPIVVDGGATDTVAATPADDAVVEPAATLERPPYIFALTVARYATIWKL